MSGAIALHQGVLYVLSAGRRAHLRLFDLGGRSLDGGFDFGSVDGAAGLRPRSFAVDDDRRIWVADEASAAVRCFNLFGVETLRFGPQAEHTAGGPARLAFPDRAGVIARPRAIAVRGSADDLELVIGSADRRRHGLQLFGPDGRLLRSLRPRGDSHGHFLGVAAVAFSGDRVIAAEARAARLQVFRRREYHFSVDLSRDSDGGSVRAIAAVGDGRLLLAFGGARSSLAVCDAGGVLLETIAGDGARERDHELSEPSGIAVDWTGVDRTSRVCVVDAGGERVQVFSLDGRCFGRIEEALG